MWIGFSTFLVNYMGFATKNNFAISLVLSECSQCIMGQQQSAEQYKHHNKHNRLRNMIEQNVVRQEQVWSGVQMVRYAPFDSVRTKGRMSLVVILVYNLIGLNIKCIENQDECSLVWTLDEINFGIHKQSLPNRISETREFYICTNMYPFNRMRDKLGIMYT